MMHVRYVVTCVIRVFGTGVDRQGYQLCFVEKVVAFRIIVF
jgi:hypothetical protein